MQNFASVINLCIVVTIMLFVTCTDFVFTHYWAILFFGMLEENKILVVVYKMLISKKWKNTTLVCPKTFSSSHKCFVCSIKYVYYCMCRLLVVYFCIRYSNMQAWKKPTQNNNQLQPHHAPKRNFRRKNTPGTSFKVGFRQEKSAAKKNSENSTKLLHFSNLLCV